MDDYLAAIDDGKGKYVDATRLGCVGASYGGYSALYLAGIQQPFQNFIADGIFNTQSMYGLLRKFSLRTLWSVLGEKQYQLLKAILHSTQ
jgi:dipeptidyl aminopeptidase/acylaminoacyl peptidase